MLVDDNTAHRKLITRALRRSGITSTIVEAASLLEAREILFTSGTESTAPEVLIVDVNLSDGRGTALVSELRAHRSLCDIPVLMLSTSKLDSDIQESYELGANGYIFKSEDPATFADDMVKGLHTLLASR